MNNDPPKHPLRNRAMPKRRCQPHQLQPLDFTFAWPQFSREVNPSEICPAVPFPWWKPRGWWHKQKRLARNSSCCVLVPVSRQGVKEKKFTAFFCCFFRIWKKGMDDVLILLTLRYLAACFFLSLDKSEDDLFWSHVDDLLYWVPCVLWCFDMTTGW